MFQRKLRREIITEKKNDRLLRNSFARDLRYYLLTRYHLRNNEILTDIRDFNAVNVKEPIRSSNGIDGKSDRYESNTSEWPISSGTNQLMTRQRRTSRRLSAMDVRKLVIFRHRVHYDGL